MEKGELTCKTGLKENVIDKEIFDREIALCRKLSKKNGGKCGWGECEKCGVMPLLYKLHKGQLLENSFEISQIKEKVLKNSSGSIFLGKIKQKSRD